MVWTNRIGNWNPQFLRECRGHLKPRSIIATLGSSLLFQVLLCLFFLRTEGQIPITDRWLYLCRFLTWTIPYFLLIVGSYYLVNDLAQEERRGTLNFIRLSPRPANDILLGKLLGVPILPYLGIASVIPLHFWSILQAQLSPTFFFSYYSLLIATAGVCFSLALLTGVTQQLRPQQTPTAIAFAALSLFFFAPIFMLWNSNTSWHRLNNLSRLFQRDGFLESINWLYISLTNNTFWPHVFTLVNLIIVGRLIWKTLERLFHQPRTTLLSKRISYIARV